MGKRNKDTEKVERKATREVEERISQVDGLRPNINTNDRTASFDGDISINESLTGSKKNGFGIIRVQVKGTTVKILHSKTCQYRVSKSDLRVFARNGGVMYFVVEILQDFSDFRIFYRSLDPFSAAIQLDAMSKNKNRNTASLEFTILPDDNDAIMRLARMLESRKDEGNWLDKDSRKYAKGNEVIVESTVPFGPEDILEGSTTIIDMSHGEQRMMLTGMDGKLIPSNVKLLAITNLTTDDPEWIDTPVGTGGNSYFERIGRKTTDGALLLYVGPLLIELDKKDFDPQTGGFKLSGIPKTVRIRTNLSRGLPTAVHQLNFLTSLFENDGVIQLGTNPWIQIHNIDPQYNEKMNQRLSTFKQAVRLLMKLGIDTSAARTTFSKDGPDDLYDSLVKNRPLTITEETVLGRKLIRRGDFILDVIFTNMVDSDGEYRIIDTFDTQQLLTSSCCDKMISSKNPEGRYITSPYAAVKAEQFAAIANLHLDRVIASFESVLEKNHNSFPDFDSTFTDLVLDDAVSTVLQLLMGADLICQKKARIYSKLALTRWKDLLHTAQTLLEWIQRYPSSNGTVVFLNMLQTKIRLTDLSDDDRTRLLSIIRNSQNPQYRLACHLLLGDIEAAQKEADRLPARTRDRLQRYPIWNLFSVDKIRRFDLTVSEIDLPKGLKLYMSGTEAQRQRLINKGSITNSKPGIYHIMNVE